MYNNFYSPNGIYPYRNYRSINPIEIYGQQWAIMYADKFLGGEMERENINKTRFRQRDEANEILQIFLTRRQDVLELIEAYGVPRRISRILTRRIIEFVIDNSENAVRDVEREVQILFRQFIRQDRVIIPILRIFRIPENIINQYIRRVIRVTLRNLEAKPDPNINQAVRRILREFEETYPNFLGLTTRYNIPVNVSRSIIRNIIRFTLQNLNRISQVGSIQRRADDMLRLLDSENPELIEAMISRGVPAQRAENITRQTILFTLTSIRLPR